MQAETHIKALYKDCEMELLRYHLRDQKFLLEMRRFAGGKIWNRLETEPTLYTEPLLTVPERQQLIHRVMVGLNFEDALLNIIWRRYLGNAPTSW
jgi:hypothetical protein